MSNDVRVEVDWSGIEREVKAQFNEMLEPIAQRVAEVAKSSTAFQDYKGTGREPASAAANTSRDKKYKLRQSIKAKKSKFDDGGWIVVATAPHAHLVELGHLMVNKEGRIIGNVPPHPFLRPARDIVARTVIAEIKAKLGLT